MDRRVNFVLLTIFCALGVGLGFVPRVKLANPHIFGGKEVDIARVPYVASIRKFFDSTNYGIRSEDSKFHCGASVIAKSFALSAAHCFSFSTEANWYEVSVGTSHIDEGGERYEVISVAAHPDFNTNDGDYDVAVIRVSTEFNFGKKIAPIVLVDVGSPSNPRTGDRMVVSGWGLTEDGDASELLRKTEVRVIDQLKCNELYEDVNEVTDRMFCAGEVARNNDACNGDSGGPIVDTKSGKQIGIVSWGVGCGNPERPGVYTRLSNPEIRHFIDSELEN